MNIKVSFMVLCGAVLICHAEEDIKPDPFTPNPICEPSSEHSKRELIELKDNYIHLVNKLTDLVTKRSSSQYSVIAEDFLSLLCTLVGGMEELVSTNQSMVYKATVVDIVPRITMQIFATDVMKPNSNSCPQKRTFQSSKWFIRDSRYCIVSKIESKVYLLLNGEREEFTCWNNEGMNYLIPLIHRGIELVMQQRLVEFCNYVHVVIRESIKIPEMVVDQIDGSYE